MYFVEIEVYCIISQTYAALSVFRTYITHGASFRCRGWDGCWGLGRLCRKGVLLFFRCPVRPFLFDQVRLTSMTLCLCFLSGLWLVDPVLSKAKLVQVLINVAPMNLQKLSKKVVIVLIILPILGILYCACKSTMPATASVSPAPRQETTN